MAPFEAGNDPADFTVGDVAEFLKSDDVMAEEYDRVLAAEAAGQSRSTLLALGERDAEAFPDGMSRSQAAAIRAEQTAEAEQARDAADAEGNELDELGTRTTLTPEASLKATMAMLDARRGRVSK